MGQKVNPISNRLGIVRGWDSNWFGGKDFGDNLVEDQKIRKYLNERLAKASVSRHRAPGVQGFQRDRSLGGHDSRRALYGRRRSGARLGHRL